MKTKLKRRWQITATAESGIHLNAEVEAESAIEALELAMIDVRAKVAPDAAPGFTKFEVTQDCRQNSQNDDSSISRRGN